MPRAQAPSSRPTLLTVQALGQNTRAVLPIYVLPGPPERLQLLPGGQIQAALGGSAGQITARVVDEGGNGVAGIGVSLSPDPVIMTPPSNATATVLVLTQVFAKKAAPHAVRVLKTASARVL